MPELPLRCSACTGTARSACSRSSADVRLLGRHCRQRLGYGSSSVQRQATFAQPRCRGALLKSRAVETDAEEEVQIEGIDRNYCDDFVCTSSPQVEQNVKALARDTTRLSSWTASLFSKDVKYKDAFLSFKGADKYKRLKFVKDVVGNPKVLVTKIRMLDKGTARVEWRLRGQVAVFPVDIDFESDFHLDLITGRVFLHSESWDLSRLSPQSKIAFSLSRAAWSLGVRGGNARDDSSGFWKRFQRKEEESSMMPHNTGQELVIRGEREYIIRSESSTFTVSDAHSQGNISADPMDPTKFFQDSDPSQDIFSVGLIVAFIWLIYQAYAEIAKL